MKKVLSCKTRYCGNLLNCTIPYISLTELWKTHSPYFNFWFDLLSKCGNLSLKLYNATIVSFFLFSFFSSSVPSFFSYSFLFSSHFIFHPKLWVPPPLYSCYILNSWLFFFPLFLHEIKLKRRVYRQTEEWHGNR